MYIVNSFCSELHYWKEWRIKASSILKSWRVNALVQTQKHNLQWHFQGVTVIFTFRKLNISNNRLDHQTLTLVLWLSKKYKFHQSDKKRQHTPWSFVFEIQYPYPERALVTVSPEYTQIYTRATMRTRLPLNYNTSFYSNTTQQRQPRAFTCFTFGNVFYFRSLGQPVSVQDAPVSLCCYIRRTTSATLSFPSDYQRRSRCEYLN